MTCFVRTAAFLIAAALSVGSSFGADPDSDLVAHYTFEEGPGGPVKDWSGNGNDGKNVGAEYVKGPKGTGYALRFEDPQAQVDCGNGPSLDLTEALTIELWYYAENQRISGGEPGLVGKTLQSYVLSGCNWLYVSKDKKRYDCPGGGTSLKVWRHVVATYDGGYLRTYRDGKRVKVVQTLPGAINHGGKFYLRYPVIWDGAVVPPVVCMMDDVRVYRRVLTAAEVREHYLAEAQARGHDFSDRVRPKVAAHVVPATGEPVIEVDCRKKYLPARTRVMIKFRDKGGQLIASHEAQLARALPVVEWTVADPVQPGDYAFQVTLEDADGALIGESLSVPVTIRPPAPELVRPFGDAKMLNNFVAELFHADDLEGQVRFVNPRDGWVLVCAPGEPEQMRYMDRGEHVLDVKKRGEVTVRAVAELIHTEVGYKPSPFMKSYGPYTWDYLERNGVLDNSNVVLIRDSKGLATQLQQWRERGGRQLCYHNIYWLLRGADGVTADTAFASWTKGGGMQGKESYGIMLDELGGTSYPAEYPHFTEALRRIAADPAFKGKVFYPYCGGLYATEQSRAFAKVVFDAGYRLAEEKYLLEQPTEAEARAYMNERLRLTMLRYQDHFPGAAAQTILTIGFISLPQETQDIDPNVDFKVYLDMQMNLLANDPAFRALYGVLWYHGAYADEEYFRWAAKLNRHYCIEGRRERLTDDPYVLPHITNGDFERDADGWTLKPARKGSISTSRSLGYGWLQGRFQRDVWGDDGDATGGGLPQGRGDHVIVLRRSDRKPNRLIQSVHELEPGRLYSLRLITVDHDELTSGKSVQRDHGIHVALDHAEIIPQLSVTEIITNGGAHGGALFGGKNKLCMNWRRIVFRATRDTTRLVISDWADDKTPGGRAGQSVAINYVQLQPYLAP